MWPENFQMYKLGLEKAGRGTRDQIAIIHWIIEKERKSKNKTKQNKTKQNKTNYFCFIDYAKAFNCVGHNKLWKILQKMGIPGHLTCLRNLYAGQKATVRTAHGTTVDSKLGKEDIYSQGCILSPCLFNLNAKYIMWNAILEEAQAGIKTAVEI